jgi:hypothetical protein
VPKLALGNTHYCFLASFYSDRAMHIEISTTPAMS